ncbi:MAG: hypothetical protein ACHQIL_07115 [Steroidobacterales bacterium]
MKAYYGLGLVLCASLAGCVIGDGRCLFLEPIQVSLAGKIHFRDFPAGGGVDNVPVLALDKTAHVYAPAESQSCIPVNDVQLVGWSEFPPDIVEGAHIFVHGSLFGKAAAHQYTRFLMNVSTVEPVRTPVH